MSLLLALAAPLGPAPVPMAASQTTVELRVDQAPGGPELDPALGGALRRRLADRLLEDGYRLVPEGSAADVRVRIAWGQGGAIVAVDGALRRQASIAGADLEVALLELQQLASALVEEARPARSDGAPGVVIELLGDGPDPALRERLQAGLLERGFPVTRAPAPGDRRLCVAEDAATIRFAVIESDAACEVGGASAAAVSVRGESGEARRERLVEAVSVALRDAVDVDDREPQGPSINYDHSVSTDHDPKSALEGSSTPPQPRAEMSVALSVHGGLAARNDAPDGLVRVELRIGRRRGLGGALDLGLVPSRAPGLRILDVIPTAAIDWRLGFRERGVVTLGAFAGVHVHTWEDEAGGGRRPGPSLGVAAGFGAIGRRGALFFGGVRAGWSGQNAVHTVSGAAVWRRAPLLVALTLGVGWDLAITGRRGR